MKVVNHKDVKADVVVIFNNGYGDNLKITMNGGAAGPEKVSAQEYRWRRLLPPTRFGSSAGKRTTSDDH